MVALMRAVKIHRKVAASAHTLLTNNHIQTVIVLMAVLALSRTLRRFVRAVKGLKAHRVLKVVMRASVAIVEPMLVMTVVPCHTCFTRLQQPQRWRIGSGIQYHWYWSHTDGNG